ncbi:MAG TPA: hypothetical protein VJV05_00230 [Pyrinomonadaceae bacterium]|nr:hypothetical protein [Pyrinomonadaceae bacterium]
MKTVNSIKFGFIALVITIVASQTFVVGQKNAGGGRLDGTWDTVVTVRNCVTGGEIVSFQSVGSFNQGGTFSGITAGMPPNRRSSERGVWAHVMANLYRFRFKAYLFNDAGVATGYQVVTHNLELESDSQSWTSSGVLQIFDLTGTQTGSGCSTAVGSRMGLD